MATATTARFAIASLNSDIDKIPRSDLETVGRYVYWADYETVEAIIRSAVNGNAPSQFIVAAALQDAGRDDEAALWYDRAARQGYKPALTKLGTDF